MMNTYQRLKELLCEDLSREPYSEVMKECDYNFNGYSDNFSKAAAWLVTVSGQEKTDENVQRNIELFKEFINEDLTDINVLEYLHAKILPNLNQKMRPVVPGTNQPSTEGGRTILKKYLMEDINSNQSDFGKNLYASIVSSQSFFDGNKRVGRLALTISELRKTGDFFPLTSAAENKLHGLGR
ncbi:hypothetical protein [uncultured Endozoicomonas sp.]|uniref:hypothetical protein n=1 Tax=uncultured Endozoicomonas sp. TaxID=432652 RepID=UPI00262ADB37|nr:hypothetical protein [uncultured Endozoicomonas sp.]